MGLLVLRDFFVWILVLMVNYSGWCEGIPEAELRALLRIKASLNHQNPNGSALRSWNEANKTTVCNSWIGVRCDDSLTRVVQLDLYNQREAKLGTWHPSAALFTPLRELRSLRLEGNQIVGWKMPQEFSELRKLQNLVLVNNRLNERNDSLLGLCMLSNLQSLDLSENQLSDDNLLPCLANLSSLLRLRLYMNNLSSPFSHKGFCGVESLQLLDLHDNQLHSGSIPPCFGNLSLLQDLDISNNHFEGNIPTVILKKFPSLQNLDLSNSWFNGVFTFSAIDNYSHLSYLDLSNNVELEIKNENPSWVPSFQLEYLNLSNCKHDSMEKSTIPRFLSKQTDLATLDLSHNKLSGHIPIWLLDSKIRHLDLRNNSFNGSFPIPSGSSSLFYMDLSSNNISGNLPSNISSIFPFLVKLTISNNALEGNIQASHCNNGVMSKLDLSNNLLSGGVPRNLFTECSSLKIYKVSKNKLNGEMLALYSEPHINLQLHTLDVSNNFLHGNLNDWSMNLTKLVVLVMRNNSFEGNVSTQICQMQHLQILDLSHNRLQGELPKCLDNVIPWTVHDKNRRYISLEGETVELTNKGRDDNYTNTPLSMLTIIDLSKNLLTGIIPGGLGYLKGLHSLNLSSNNLTGPIPASFQNLDELESLDLSHNQLNGTIPGQLNTLHYLSFLSVANNNLSGRIPQGPQFDTFNQSSFEGNPNLSGKPLKNCIPCIAQPMKTSNKREGPDWLFYLWVHDWLFYLWVLASYAIGFWSFTALVFFNRGWRNEYFKAIDTCLFFCYDFCFGAC